MMRRNIAILGIVGLVGCFLPLVPGLSVFDLRHFAEGWSAWLVMGAFATAAYVGATAKTDIVAGLARCIRRSVGRAARLKQLE